MTNAKLQFQFMQDIAYPALQAATILGRTQAAASVAVKLIYRADDWFQDNVVPLGWMTIALSISGWMMAIVWTVNMGRNAGEWFREWFAAYVVAAIPELVEEPQLALAGVQVAGLLPAAAPLRLPARWVGDDVILVGAGKKGKGRRSRNG